MARARRTSERPVGVSTANHDRASRGSASVRLDCGGGSQLSIFRRGPSTADHSLAHFEVADIDATIRDLERRGVTFLNYAEGPLRTTGHIAQIGPARGAWFRDPDGNVLGLRRG